MEYRINPIFSRSFNSENKSLDFLKGMNERQLEAINHKDGPALVIAGAGTGKTSVLTNRIAKLIADGVSPEQILALTFTNKAANEMKERITLKLGEEELNVTACTYHSFSTIMLRRYGEKVGIPRNFTIMDSTDCADALNLIKERLGYGKLDNFPKGKELLMIFSSHINNDEPIDEIVEDRFPLYDRHLGEIFKIRDAYRNYKAERNILDYDDILVKFYELISVDENLARYLSDKYKYMLVDEYQDSNLIQFKIIKRMRSFGNDNIMVVGDDFQSIYMFRGARFENIINFPKEFEGCKLIILNTNYRSNQEILDLANGLIECAKEKYEKDLVGTRKKGSKPTIVEVDNLEMEAEFVLSRIKELHENDGLAYKDMAAIIRGARDSYILEKYLTKFNIPYEKFGGTKFMEKKHIKDVMSFLKVSVNDKDEIAWFRILSLYPNIGAVYAKQVTDEIMKHGVDELLNTKYTTKKYGQYLPELHRCIIDTQDMSLQDKLDYYIEYRYDLTKRVIKLANKTESSKKELFRDNEYAYEESGILIDFSKGYKDAESFLTDLTLEAPSIENDEDYFNVSTVHSAKGLEYNTVFVLSCLDGTFPWDFKPKTINSRTIRKKELEIEEERRILYVAITRAKENLYLMLPLTQFYGGYGSSPSISRFLKENNIKNKYTETMRVRY